MEIINIPFVKKIGIQKNQKGELGLPFNDSVQNHLQTIHASALFSLAEAASGEILQTKFSELVGRVVPVVRDSKMKFRKPATKSVIARPSIREEVAIRFREQFEKKNRASIEVDVEVKDSDGSLVCAGTFNWFVQGVE